MRGSKRRVFAVMTTAVLALAVATAALAGSTQHRRRQGGGRLVDGLAERDLRRVDARVDVSQVARRGQGAIREGKPGREREVRAHTDQQRAVHRTDRGGVRLEEGSGRDARLLGRLHDAVHAELAREAQRPRQADTGLLRQARRRGISRASTSTARAARATSTPSRTTRHLRALLQQGALPKAGVAKPAEDVQRAARRSARSSRPKGSSRSPTATVTATRPTTG